MHENAFPNCGLQWIHIKGSPHRFYLNFLTLHSQPPTEHQAPRTPNSGTSLHSHLDFKMLFTSQHLALSALAGLNALAAAQSPSNQTQAPQPPVRADRSPPFIGGRKTEDSLSILPLHPKARTGLIDPVLEEGLISMGTTPTI
jgi:hypothetical protein